LTGAEGGRVDLKPGGIVEPGVTHYGAPGSGAKPGQGEIKWTDLKGSHLENIEAWRKNKEYPVEEARKIYESSSRSQKLRLRSGATTGLKKKSKFDMLDKNQENWFKKHIFSNPDSQFYRLKWKDISGTKKYKVIQQYNNFVDQKAILDDLAKKGYVMAPDWFEKQGISVSKFYWIRGAQRAEKAATGWSQKRWDILKDGGELKVIKKQIGDTSYSFLKSPDKKRTAEIVKLFNNPDPYIHQSTIKNIEKLLKPGSKYRTMLLSGNYPTIKALPTWIKPNSAATAVYRIAQLLNGHKFENFDPKIKPDKAASKRMFAKLDTEPWGKPYSSMIRKLNMQLIQNELGTEYFDNTYGGFVTKARNVLKNAALPIDIDLKMFDINELTGLTSGARNKTFTSTQFVNLLPKEYNRIHHASMLKEYGKYEEALQTALKKGSVNFKDKTFTSRQLVNHWQKWQADWFEGLPKAYKTKSMSSTLPSFKLGENTAQTILGKKRIKQLLDLGLTDITKDVGYFKTWGKDIPTMRSQPVLKELVNNPNAAIKLLKQAGYRCTKQLGGGEDVACYLRDVRNQLKSVKNRQPGIGRKLARFRNFGKKVLLWGFGPVDIVIEALFAAHGVASGHGKDQIWADSLLGMIIPQSLGGPEWGDEMRLDKIAELGGEEYVNALKQEQEFNSLLDKYSDVDKIPADVRGYNTKEYKERLYADLDKVWDEYAVGQEYLTVPKDARPTELDEKGEPLWPRNLGPRDQVMKWSQDLNPDSFAAEKFRLANEKLQAEEAAVGQASGVSPIRLETQEAENIRKTRDIGEHPRGEDYWTEFFRTLRGWDPAWRGPEGTGYSFRQEGMDYMAEGGIAGLLKKK